MGHNLSVLTVAGIDVGLSYLESSSGVCRTGRSGFVLTHTYVDKRSRFDALGDDGPFDVLSIDGPLEPGLRLRATPRLCEKLFVLGTFQRRCKPGESQIAGTGRALKRAATDTALQFIDQVSGESLAQPFPRVVQDRNIVEAFPNAFLGVLVAESDYETLRAGRREKTRALLELVRHSGGLRQLRALLAWDDDELWKQLAVNSQHDESAALICALTAICVARGIYTAVGDDTGGFFFLPPWNLWQPWAREQLCLNLDRKDCSTAVPGNHVWVDGARA